MEFKNSDKIKWRNYFPPLTEKNDRHSITVLLAYTDDYFNVKVCGYDFYNNQWLDEYGKGVNEDCKIIGWIPLEEINNTEFLANPLAQNF